MRSIGVTVPILLDVKATGIWGHTMVLDSVIILLVALVILVSTVVTMNAIIRLITGARNGSGTRTGTIRDIGRDGNAHS